MQIDHRTGMSRQALALISLGLVTILSAVFATGCGIVGSGSTDLPAAPSGLTTEAAEAEVVLNWNEEGTPDSYNVYRATSSVNTAENTPVATDITSTSYTDESIENGTTYYYRVTAVVKEGSDTKESEGSEEVKGTPFTQPTNLNAATGDSEIALDWRSAKGVDTYGVYRSTSSSDEVAEMELLTSDVSGSSYVDRSAENGTTYYYRVTSINPEEQESTGSNEVVQTPFATPPNRP